MSRWRTVLFRTTMAGVVDAIKTRLRGAMAKPRSMVRVITHQVVVFVALLLIIIQLVIFIAIDSAVAINARQKIHEELQVGERIFYRLMDGRSQQLITAARVLTFDFAFRQALTTGDQRTVASALSNHALRIGASKMILVAPDNKILSDASASSDAAGEMFAFPDLIAEAVKRGNASGIKLISGIPYQLVVVPVLAPAPVGWLVLGFSIDGKLAAELGVLTSLEVSFATWQKDAGWHLAASTMRPELRSNLLRMLTQTLPESAATRLADLSGDDYVTSASMLTTGSEDGVVAILQRSLNEAIARFSALRIAMLVLAGLSLAGTILGSVSIARSISRPVTALVTFARQLEQGNYDQGPPATRADELGELASAFNNMRLAISAREQEIKAMAYHDALTGLPNRALFNDRLTQAIAVATRLDHPVSVMLIDLNRFKEVNDTFGHHAGDLLLREVGMRLRGILGRATDTAARLGGDEFAVILPAASRSMAEEAAQRILRTFDDPVTFEGRPLDVGGSIGVATFPEHGHDPHVLMSHADAAMYHAKRKRLGFMVYEAHLDAEPETCAQLALSIEMRHAVERNEFFLHYQPRWNLTDTHQLKADALIRWQHPTRGLLLPGEFIPCAEQTGFIREISYWVMDTVFKQTVGWHEQGLAINISINLSGRDLLSEDFPTKCSDLLSRHGASPRWFTFEITESTIMHDPAGVLNAARRLREIGFSIAIANFGTGYSSLALIKKLPLVELKIDRASVMNMVGDTDNMMIVRSMVELSHNLGLHVVAEGVETAQAAEMLEEMGCDFLQGHYICKPVVPEQLEKWLSLPELTV